MHSERDLPSQVVAGTSNPDVNSVRPHPQTVYCDESGFSGNNMFDSQPFFVYTAAAVENDHAKKTVETLIKRHGLQGNELKGARLLKFSKGRKAVLELLLEHHKRVRCAVFHKKYSLACKFFEYIFEPVLAKKSSLFYQTGFHKFISNVVYMHLAVSAPYAEDHLREFQEMMRLENLDPPHLLGSIELSQLSPALREIRDFARIHEATIRQELASTVAGSAGNWVLDVTCTALFSLLAEFGQQFPQMRVICDDSKPLQADRMLFEAMINRTDKVKVRLEDRDVPLTFNLSGPIEFGNSRDYHGIQVSDVAAAAFNYACSHPRDEFTRKVQPFLEKCISGNSVWPDETKIDLGTVNGIRNELLLQKLVERSRKGIPVLEGIEVFIAGAHDAALSRLARSETGAFLPARDCGSDLLG